MTIALIANTSLTPVANSGGTSPAITTTGANLICIAVGHYQPNVGSLVLSDSKSNTWTLAIRKFDGSASDISIFYCLNPIVGASHTFTVAGLATYSTLCAEAFSGVNTVFGIDQISVGGAAAGSPVQPGSVTPGTNGSLVYTAASVTGDATNTRVFGINSGMTIADQVPYNSGLFFGSMGSYLIQSVAAAINPSVTYTGTVGAMAAATVTFRGPAASSTLLRGQVCG